MEASCFARPPAASMSKSRPNGCHPRPLNERLRAAAAWQEQVLVFRESEGKIAGRTQWTTASQTLTSTTLQRPNWYECDLNCLPELKKRHRFHSQDMASVETGSLGLYCLVQAVCGCSVPAFNPSVGVPPLAEMPAMPYRHAAENNPSTNIYMFIEHMSILSPRNIRDSVCVPSPPLSIQLPSTRYKVRAISTYPRHINARFKPPKPF